MAVRYWRLLPVFFAMLGHLGCGSDGEIGAAGATSVARAQESAEAKGESTPRTAWERGLASTNVLGTRRGWRVARTVLHVHSPLSHDACDREGWVDGRARDPRCLAHLREAACTLHVDALMLTDHPSHLAEVPFRTMLWPGPGATVASANDGTARIACEDGHRVVVSAGVESALMAVGLDRHVEGRTLEERAALYDDDGARGADALRRAGGVVIVPHTEGRSVGFVRRLRPDAIEIYNAHANVDPVIRRTLGLEAVGHIGPLIELSDVDSGVEPDLVLFAFLAENRRALDTWDTLLAEGHMLTGVAGTDAHENTFPEELADGERGDSYRRMMRWFSNHLLVRSVTQAELEDALRVGRAYVVFEALGTPLGFDFVADAGEERVVEMGGTAPVGATLVVRAPRLLRPVRDARAPEIRTRIIRAARGGGQVVAETRGPLLTFRATEPGAYRAEVRMVPWHLAPYLGESPAEWITERAWIYAGPIRVARR